VNTKIYHLENCSTCKKAAAWLAKRGIDAQFIPIKQKTPSVAELQKAYEQYQGWSRIFNTSGMEYRARKLSEKLPSMTDKEILNLLQQNGMLIKRPFLVTDNGIAAGFKEAEWEKIFSHAK
jgi:arsenate reductase